MKYVVAGGAGFIGSHIVDLLISLNHEVIVLDNFSTGKRCNIPSKATVIEIDLSTVKSSILGNLLYNCAAVFHCAALPNVQFSIEYPRESNTANVDTTINILEAMRLSGVPKIIYSSSSSVYGDTLQLPTNEDTPIQPVSQYALQKYIGELYCQLYSRIYNIQYTIFRYFNVYGERMTDNGAYVSVLSHFIRSYKKNLPLNITNNGEQKRDFIYVKDVARANIAAIIHNDCNNQIFNIGYGTNYSVNTLASMFNSLTKYGEHRIEPFETLANIDKAKLVLNWCPETNAIDWIKNILKDI